jgi:hypothetical protein
MEVLEVHTERSRAGGFHHGRPHPSAVALPPDRPDALPPIGEGDRPAREVREVDHHGQRLDDAHAEPAVGGLRHHGGLVGNGELHDQRGVQPGRDLLGDEPGVQRTFAGGMRCAIEGRGGALQGGLVSRGRRCHEQSHDCHHRRRNRPHEITGTTIRSDRQA